MLSKAIIMNAKRLDTISAGGGGRAGPRALSSIYVGHKLRCRFPIYGPSDAFIEHTQISGRSNPYIGDGNAFMFCCCFSSFLKLAYRPNGLLFDNVIQEGS